MATATGNCRHGIDGSSCKRCLEVARLMERRWRNQQPARVTVTQVEAARPAALPRLRPTSVVTQHTLLADIIRSFKGPFTREQLCVAAWQKHPEAFGLEGFPHPDSHKVSSVLYGAKGLLRLRVLQRTTDGKFIARMP